MSTNNTVTTTDTSTVDSITVAGVATKAATEMEKKNSEEASSSSSSFSWCCKGDCFSFCIQPCTKVLIPMCVKFVIGLAIALVAGVLEAFLAISIFLRSTRMHGTSGTYASAIPAIGIIAVVIFISYAFFLYMVYRWRKLQRQRQTDRRQQHYDCNDEDTEQGQSYNAKIDWEVPSSEATRQVTFPSWDTFAKRRMRRFCLQVMLPLSFLLLVGTEVALVLNIPRNAIFPMIPPFAQDALSDDAAYRPSTCDLANRWEKAKSFFRNNTALDFNKVKLVYGGMTFSKNVLASEYDNTIYFWKYSCPSEETLVHELTHVVQEQTGYWSGPGAPRRAFDMVFTECRSCLYDYTYEDLQSTMELALASGDERITNVYQAFNPEQVAEIVEDYYTVYDRCRELSPLAVENDERNTSASASASNNNNNNNNPFWYCDALRYYATQVTGGD